MWQQQDPQRRFADDQEPHKSGSEQSKPSEVLVMGGLVSPVAASDVFSTQSDLFCYQYC